MSRLGKYPSRKLSRNREHGRDAPVGAKSSILPGKTPVAGSQIGAVTVWDEGMTAFLGCRKAGSMPFPVVGMLLKFHRAFS